MQTIVAIITICLLALAVTGVALLLRKTNDNHGIERSLGDLHIDEETPPAQPVPPSSDSDDPLSPAVTSTPPGLLGTTILIGDDELKKGYELLRGRPELQQIKAVWSAGYDAEAAYFKQELADIKQHAAVRVERVVSAHSPHVRTLHKLATEHPGIYKLFTSASFELSFEVYVCEYGPHAGRPSSTSGILTVVHPDGREPEFGFLVDGYVNGELTQFARALGAWFESVKGSPVGESELHDVWDANAPVYDQHVSRESRLPFLRNFIRAEDACLTRLIENDESEQDLTYIEFGSGTGRTIDYLRALPHITDRVVYFVGLDNSEQMVGRARQKRDGALAAGHDKTFYFLLDAADATRNFGNGRIHLTGDLNDRKQVSSHGLEPERYESTRRLICCLLNTVGIVRGDLRERMVASMFACAHADDTVVISVFSGEAFEKHAFPLYRDIQPLVGTDVVPGEFSNDTQTFSAGNYYSQWLWIDDVRSLIERSGGVVVDVRDIEDGNREHLGRFFVCERRVEEPKVAS